MNTDKRIIVIGAVNVDISGTSKNPLLLYDSNPGNSHTSFGGVGRNIAENLCRLGYKVDMITVLGGDLFTEQLLKAAKEIGISFEHSMVIPNAHCSTYICVNNNDGNMMLAVSDMDIYDEMSVDFISEKMDFINSADYVVIDTNVPKAVIDYVAEHATVPLITDPVSTTKSVKLADSLGKFFIVKPNAIEAEALTGMKLETVEDVPLVAKKMIDMGVKNVFISMGTDGVFYSNGEQSGLCPIIPGEVVNTTGCGDAFVAALLWSFANGNDIRQSARFGVAASTICSRNENTISPYMSADMVRQMALRIPITE